MALRIDRELRSMQSRQVVGLALGGLMLFGPAMAQNRAAQVGVDAVISEPYAQTKPILGRVVAVQDGVVAARVSGPIAAINVAPGDRVATGAELGRLDLTRLQIEKELASADLTTARSELATAQAEVAKLVQERRRLERLQGSAAFSPAQLDDKVQDILVAQSRIDAANARLARAEVVDSFRQTDIDDGLLRAPYPGVVVRKLVSAGAFVSVGDPVIEMVNDEDVEIEADVPTELLAGLNAGAQIAYTLGGQQTGGQQLSAILRAVVPVENAMTRTLAVRFVPEDAALTSTIGQSVTVQLPTGAQREVVTVHKDAVLVRQGNRSVFKVGDNNKVVPQTIEVGVAVGGRFEVVSGLEAGDVVVIRGNERLRPGQEVVFRASKDEQAPSSAQRDNKVPPAEGAERS